MRREIVTCDACGIEVGGQSLSFRVMETGGVIRKELDLCGPKCLADEMSKLKPIAVNVYVLRGSDA